MNALNVRTNGIYVDATFGRGGHGLAILDQLDETGRLIGLDQDPTAITFGQAQCGTDARLTLIQSNFAELDSVLSELAVHGLVDGILIDLGVSSPQLDEAARGFSFRADGPLDMRMNPTQGESAADWIADVDQGTLAHVIRSYGEDRFADRIARAIVEARQQQVITRTVQLAHIVEQAVPRARSSAASIHPATRTFQAIRIQINRELDVLSQVLDRGIEALGPGGRFVVISFHSLEDRLVKRAFRAASTPPPASRRSPVAPEFTPRLKTIGSLIRPDETESRMNPRARSARMRVAEKLACANHERAL